MFFSHGDSGPRPTPAAPAEEDRPQRPLPLRQRQEIQEVLREIGIGERARGQGPLPPPQAPSLTRRWKQLAQASALLFSSVLLSTGESLFSSLMTLFRGCHGKIDLKKELKPLYTASAQEAILVTALAPEISDVQRLRRPRRQPGLSGRGGSPLYRLLYPQVHAQEGAGPGLGGAAPGGPLVDADGGLRSFPAGTTGAGP